MREHSTAQHALGCVAGCERRRAAVRDDRPGSHGQHDQLWRQARPNRQGGAERIQFLNSVRGRGLGIYLSWYGQPPSGSSANGLSGNRCEWERCYRRARACAHTHTVSVSRWLASLMVAVKIALAGKPTTQSSTSHGGVSSRAVDGNTNGNYGAGSCTHTESQGNAWWTVDLQATYAVDKVTRFCSTACAPAASPACRGRWLCITG